MLYLRDDRYILLKNVMFLSIEIYYDILKFFFIYKEVIQIRINIIQYIVFYVKDLKRNLSIN